MLSGDIVDLGADEDRLRVRAGDVGCSREARLLERPLAGEDEANMLSKPSLMQTRGSRRRPMFSEPR